MYVTLKELHRVFPASHLSIAANDPHSWSKFSQIDIISSLCTFVADCRLGIWRNHLFRMVSMPILLSLVGLFYRLIGVKCFFGNAELRRLLGAYYNADLVLSCGGGNFFAHKPFSPALIWALITLGFAQLLGKKTIMLQQSIGPIKGTLQKYFVRLVLNRVHTIMVREPQSEDFVSSVLRLHKTPILFPDLAFWLPNSPNVFPNRLPKQSSPPRIGVTVINRGVQDLNFKDQDLYEETLAKALINLSKKYNAQINIFTQCYGPSRDQDDRYAALKLYRRLIRELDDVTCLNNFKNALELYKSYGSMDLIVGSRMHTGIFAFINAIPVVLIGYQPKSVGMMKLFDLEGYCIPIESASNEQLLVDLVCDAFEHRAELSRKIAERYQEILKSIDSWTRYLEL